ncbi:MAG TPA: bifunctional metallophosphatase/5'-nucleotidase [Candidatus Acidoferrum sp.]|nr:bifunctional metallophosphatase/5'-nucleotidase [Candidatus Acidoferrum sp.]
MMEAPRAKSAVAADEKKNFALMPSDTPSRREVLALSVAVGAMSLAGVLSAAAQENGKKTFTILHTNDMHSAFIGLGPASDYSPFELNNDQTRGGYARLAGLIAERREVAKAQGPVLVLDAGDYSMGTAFAAASRETGGELQLMSRMGYDATTFGNHDFDLGPDGLAKSIDVAGQAGRIPAILASNTEWAGSDTTLAGLQHLAQAGVIRRHLVIERGGLRFGLFGLLGKEAQFYATGAGAVTFSDAIAAATQIVKTLRETEKVDVVVCLSHGGLEKDKDGHYSDGDDIRLAKAVPGIDVVIGGHSHTELQEAIIVNDHTPVVQTGVQGRNLGELVVALDGGKLTVESYRLYPIDDSVAADQAVADEIERLKKTVSADVFASRGYSIDQALVVVPQDIPNTFVDIAASTLLANLVTDAFRNATTADIGFTVNGLMRAGFTRGKSGVQTVYDVFAVAPLGAGVVDPTAGSALVTAYFTGQELKHLLEFFLVDSPAHPGEYFPRSSGMRFRYDSSRPKFDVVTAIELGDIDRGYGAIDITGKDERLYSLTCSLYLGLIVVAIPKYTKGKLTLVPKNKEGQPLKSRVEALDDPREDTPYLLPPPGTTDKGSVAIAAGNEAVREIKEWQAIMDHLRGLPAKSPGELPVIPVDERATEVRAIKAG